MPPYPHLDPAPFAFPAPPPAGTSTRPGDVGVLLLHGLTGSPTEMRGLGEHLHQHGFSVSAPLLPGHGTHHFDLEKATKEQWIEAARAELRLMRASMRKTFIVGQSMGGLVALALAAEESVDGVVGLAPALVVSRLAWFAHLCPALPRGLRHLPKLEERHPDLREPSQLREVWSYTHTPLAAVREVLRLQNDVRGLLPRITQPILVLQGRHDQTVSLDSATRLLDEVGSVDKELVWLEDSGHIISVDRQRQAVFARAVAFIHSRADLQRQER